MTTATAVTQLNPKPEQPAMDVPVAAVTAAEKAPAKKAAAEKAPAKKAPAAAAKKAPATKKAAAVKKAAPATPPRDLSKVTAREQSELRNFVIRMVWATPLWKFRKDAGIPGEVPDQVIQDAIDVFAKYISPASYETKDGKRTRRS
jgi:hypothetical protein